MTGRNGYKGAVRTGTDSGQPFAGSFGAKGVRTVQERRLGSRYVLTERLGRGATGQVYRARVDDAAQPPSSEVAVKVLQEELGAGPVLIRRFLQEGQLLKSIDHPNVVRIRDLVAEGDQLAIVMDLVAGGDLRHAIAMPCDEDRAVRIVAGVAAGLAAVHAAGITHRDVKPENVLIEQVDGVAHPRIADFGVSRFTDATTTTSKGMTGTVGYIAPEVARGGPATPASDVYALGVILYELCVGHGPFKADHPVALIRAHAEDPVPRPDGMTDGLWALVEDLLAKQPEARPSATDVARRAAELATSGAGSQADDATVAQGRFALAPALTGTTLPTRDLPRQSSAPETIMDGAATVRTAGAGAGTPAAAGAAATLTAAATIGTPATIGGGDQGPEPAEGSVIVEVPSSDGARAAILRPPGPRPPIAPPPRGRGTSSAGSRPRPAAFVLAAVAAAVLVAAVAWFGYPRVTGQHDTALAVGVAGSADQPAVVPATSSASASSTPAVAAPTTATSPTTQRPAVRPMAVDAPPPAPVLVKVRTVTHTASPPVADAPRTVTAPAPTVTRTEVLTTSAAAPSSSSSSPPPAPVQPVKVDPRAGTVPLFRYWNPVNGDHFYTTDFGELGAGRLGYRLEKVQAHVYPVPHGGTVPLYRYWNSRNGDHFYTTNYGELGAGRSGYRLEKIQAYVYPSPRSGTVPIFRYWNARNGDHFYTTNYRELGAGRSGYRLEGIAGYSR
jgi:serine/threonine-protein kinase